MKEDEAATMVIAPSGSVGPRSEAAGSGGAHGPEKRSGGARAGSRVEPRRRRHMRAEWSEDDRRHCGRGEGGRGSEPGPRAREVGWRGAGRAPGSTRAAAPRAGRAERRQSPHRGGVEIRAIAFARPLLGGAGLPLGPGAGAGGAGPARCSLPSSSGSS